MRTSTYQKISRGAMRGWIEGEIYNHLPATFFEDPISSVREMKAEVIKDSRWRWACLFYLPNGKRIFLKRDRTKDWIESLKYLLLPSRGQKEWFISYRLRRQHLNIPKALGWLERVKGGFLRESYFLSEAIGKGVPLIGEGGKPSPHPSILELAKILRKIHDSGLFHRDLHGGNFLWDGDSLFLTDLHRAKILKTLSLDQRLWNLSQLFHSLRASWGEKEQERFIEKYFEGEVLYSQEKERRVQRIRAFMEDLQKRQWLSRTKRCLKESTEFSVCKEKGVRYYHRREVPLDRIRRSIEEHRGLVREKPFLLVKDGPGVAVSILNGGSERVCVKQFRFPTILGRVKDTFRRSKGLKAWIAANGLRARGISSIKTFAMAERRGWLGPRESFLLMEASGEDQEMDRYLLKGFRDFQEKRSFVRSFARWLASVHQKRLFHKDMKTCNIVVSGKGEEWKFCLLDLEDVLLNKRVGSNHLFKSFLQLNTSTPRVMTRTDRLRFFSEYVRLHPIVQNGGDFLRRLAQESKRRDLVYVSPQGVVIERM
ncbi:MAG: lipopolysaccharide kinase InaA family protein [Thermodesulfobacteriota bacterium]